MLAPSLALAGCTGRALARDGGQSPGRVSRKPEAVWERDYRLPPGLRLPLMALEADVNYGNLMVIILYRVLLRDPVLFVHFSY